MRVGSCGGGGRLLGLVGLRSLGLLLVGLVRVVGVVEWVGWRLRCFRLGCLVRVLVVVLSERRSQLGRKLVMASGIARYSMSGSLSVMLSVAILQNSAGLDCFARQKLCLQLVTSVLELVDLGSPSPSYIVTCRSQWIVVKSHHLAAADFAASLVVSAKRVFVLDGVVSEEVVQVFELEKMAVVL